MKVLALQADKILSQMSARTSNIVRHIGWSFVFKTGSVLANFMIVPLAISYLGKENYGIWLTLSSVIAWFSLFDIGLGNGLRNKFAEARALGKDHDARAFVSTAYYTIGTIVVVLVAGFISLNQLLDWNQIFNTSSDLSGELSLLLPVVFGFFGLQLVSKLIVSIFQAEQHHSIQNKVQFFGQVLSLMVVWLLTLAEGNSLLLFGSLYASFPVLVLLALNVFAFRGRYKAYRPSFSLCKKAYLSEITGLGLKFFIIQIAAVVLFSTDNFIITQLFGPAEVVPYNVAFKYFSIVTMGYSILIAPYWSSFTEAYAKQDLDWIRGSVSRIQKIWFLVPVALSLMVLLSNWFYRIWVGETVKVPIELSIAMAVFVAMLSFNMIYVQFVNGVGKIRLQIVIAIIVTIINIPLSVTLGKYMGLGPTGVVLATAVCLSASVVVFPIQYIKLMNGSAEGVWDK